MRFRYDASLAYQSWYELNKYININGIISVDAFDFLMETAGNHKESLPGDGGNSKLDTLAERFGILESEFESKIKYDRHKEKIIDNLHKERQDYKNDLVKSLLRPMIMDIIHSIGGNTTLVNNLKEDVPQLDPQELVKQMEGILYELEEVLFRQGV
jgi:molecular chaperone GrpE (heat shock protein)